MTLKAKFDALVHRLTRYADEDDARQRALPKRWHIIRLVLGCILAVKGAGIVRHAEGLEGFALAALLLAIAAAVIIEAARMLLPFGRARAKA